MHAYFLSVFPDLFHLPTFLNQIDNYYQIVDKHRDLDFSMYIAETSYSDTVHIVPSKKNMIEYLSELIGLHLFSVEQRAYH